MLFLEREKDTLLQDLSKMKGYDETDRVLSHADIVGCSSCLTSINSFRTETLSVFTPALPVPAHNSAVWSFQ